VKALAAALAGAVAVHPCPEHVLGALLVLAYAWRRSR